MSAQSRHKGQGSSIHSSRSSPLPPPSFNFHGLVNSQQGTQSQYNNDDANYLDDGSQKENVGDADMAVDKGVADDLPAASIIAPTNASPHVGSPFRPKGSPLAPSSSSPIVSRPAHSARLKPTFTTPTYPRKGTPPPSQDSFLNTLPDRGFIQSPPRDATLSQIAKAQTESDSPELLVMATPSASSQVSSSDHEDQDADMVADSFQCAQPRPELDEEDYNGPWDAENNPTQEPSQQSEDDYISQSTQIAEGSPESTHPYVPTDPALYRYIHNIIRMCPGNWRMRVVSNRGVSPNLVARMQEGDFSQPELDVSTSAALDFEPTQPSCEDEYKKPVRRLQPPTRAMLFDMVETQPTYPKPESMLPPPGPGDPPMSYEEATSGLVETQPSNAESYRKPARTLPPPVCTVPTRRDESLDIVPDSDPRTTSYPSPFMRSGRLLENSAIPKQAANISAMDDDIVPDSLEIERESQIPHVSPHKEAKPSSTEGKGKEHADKSMKPPSMPAERTPTKQTSPVQNKRKREGSVGSSIVPSSILNETDQPPATIKRAATKGKKKANPSTRKRTSRRTAKGKERQATLSGDEEDDDVSPTKREPESTLLLSSAGPSRKRQRLTSEASSVKQEGSTVSRSGKRPPVSVAVDNVRIIGHWRGDNSWYVGSITGRKSKGLCHIRFDDSSTSELALTDIRVLKLKVGDAVSIARSSTILESGEIGAVEITEDGKVRVRLGRREEMVDTGSLRFPNKSVREYWNDRILTLDMLSSSGDAQLGLFSGYGFMVTGLEEPRKAQQLAEIQSADGRVYENWQNLIAWGGDYRQNGDWHIEKGRAKWCGAMNIQSIFLLAPKQNEKPKYLIALALGIPCVDIAWVHNSVKANRILDWRTYLLPAGVYAQRTVSQRVDLEWQKSDLGMVLENPVSTKPLEDLDILCVGSELVPKKNLDARDGVHGIPFILFAMGANRVDVVKNVPPKKTLKQFDYVVFNNSADIKDECDHGKVVVWQVLKESLLAGRLLI